MSFNDAIVWNRFLGLLIWQWFLSTTVFILFKTLFLSLLMFANPFPPSLAGCLAFLTFHVSLLLFSTAVFVVGSPRPDRAASPFELTLGLVQSLLISGESTPNFRRRTKVSLSFLLFAMASAISGFLAVVSMCWANYDASDGVLGLMASLGLRGFAFGLLYGLHYLLTRRWILEFPIIQRPLFFSFKMGLPSAIRRALRLSVVACLLLVVLVAFLPQHLNVRITIRKFITEQINFFLGSIAVFLCWESSHHLHQVIQRKRFIFAPPKGSAAAETNPSEPLFAALEESPPGSLLQYLAYLDLCMVCESNVDTWRRAAFFEETGETYKRVMAVCLRPLEQLASGLSGALGSCSVDGPYEFSHQWLSTELYSNAKCCALFTDFQLCSWSAWTIAALTVRSHKEDRFGVAQLSGSNASVISTLISSLLAVETFMGKKTTLHSPHNMMGPAGIKWATINTRRREVTMDIINRKRDRSLHKKAYIMADILRTSIYYIVSAFHEEMLSAAKSGLLEKDWIISSKPLYGTHDHLLQKLHIFLDFQAN